MQQLVDKKLVSLDQAVPGARVRLVSIGGGRQMTRRLLALGISLGNELEVLHRRGRGVVVARDGNRVALGGGVAECLMTELLDR